MADTKQDTRIPVTVITGFLGAGKTTLINHILTVEHGKKIAIIENEYGEIGIDSGLVLDTKEELYEASNGCLCCTGKDECCPFTPFSEGVTPKNKNSPPLQFSHSSLSSSYVQSVEI